VATSGTPTTNEGAYGGALDHPPGLLARAVPCQPATCSGDWIEEGTALDVAEVGFGGFVRRFGSARKEGPNAVRDSLGLANLVLADVPAARTHRAGSARGPLRSRLPKRPVNEFAQDK
jgi:hypothetical protein